MDRRIVVGLAVAGALAGLALMVSGDPGGAPVVESLEVRRPVATRPVAPPADGPASAVAPTSGAGEVSAPRSTSPELVAPPGAPRDADVSPEQVQPPTWTGVDAAFRARADAVRMCERWMVDEAPVGRTVSLELVLEPAGDLAHIGGIEVPTDRTGAYDRFVACVSSAMHRAVFDQPASGEATSVSFTWTLGSE